MTTGNTAVEVIGNQGIMLSPADVVANATVQAKILMDIVEKTHCYQIIAGKKYLQVEAWETIGAFNRVHAVTETINPIVRDGATVGYDAKVNLMNERSLIVGAAIMPCYFTENACKGKEGDAKDKACKSAAQTFATSKAYRMNYSYVAILAGYEPTPAEEVTGESSDDKPPTSKQKEHWCEKHQTHWFKKGKMQHYAHPVDGSKEWCQEPKEQPETMKPTAEPTSDQAFDAMPSAAQKPQPEIVIDMSWLKESLTTLDWHDVGKWLNAHFKCTGSKVSEMVASLTPDQQKAFAKEVEDRLAMKG